MDYRCVLGRVVGILITVHLLPLMGGLQSAAQQTRSVSSSGTTSNQSRTTFQTQGTSTQVGELSGRPAISTTSAIGTQQVPGAAKVVSGPTALGLADAISLAIQNNLATLLAKERRNEAHGFAQQSRAGLLPNISGNAYQANVTLNLAALGFQPATFPGISTTFIGPFNNFDARASLAQTIFSLSAIRNYQAGRAGEQVAELQEQLAREQVATAVALAYLDTLRTERSVIAAQADVDLAQTLLKLAQDQHTAGVATGVDVTRADTRLAQERVRLALAHTASDQSRLQLQRIVGLELGGPLTLIDPLRFIVDPLPAIAQAITQAEQDRPEVQIASAQLTLNDYERKAARAELLPNLEFVGDYGVSGITPTNTDLPTRRVAVQLNVPIFNGGLTRGRITVATSQLRQAELELSTTRGQVAEDVRLAFSALSSTAEAVRAADQSVLLAQQELQMARDRFRAGVGDNIEVIAAQTSLANARDSQITALTQFNAARLNLAASLGRAQTFRW